MSRLISVLSLFVPLSLVAADGGAAFSWLRAMESQPYAGTSKVVEVRGERADPFPKEWIVLLNDSSARGGVREITIANGKITSERTPLRGQADTAGLLPMERDKLSFGADGVFRLVQREAERGRVGFHWLDYMLRADPESKAAVWHVKLHDYMGAPVGNIRISAQDGTIVRALQIDPAPGAHTPAKSVGTHVGNFVDDVGNSAKRTAKKSKDSTLRFIGTLQEEFLGERTIGPKEEDE